MRQTITAYRVTTTRAYRMDELGTGYSLYPGNDTDRYKQTTTRVTVELSPNVTVGEDAYSLPAIVQDGRAYTLQEAIDLDLARVLRPATAAEAE